VTDLVAFCESLARWLHREQVDKQGTPYVAHLERVAARIPDDQPAVKAAAWLHDAVEDGLVIWATLDLLGIPDDVSELVGLLTRDNRKPYNDYIARIVEDRSAIAIKLADLEDNLDESRGPIPDSLRKRYERARALLKSVTRSSSPAARSSSE
jgi:(p)ppGpp synthase/HD superfamily hydrolase